MKSSLGLVFLFLLSSSLYSQAGIDQPTLEWKFNSSDTSFYFLRVSEMPEFSYKDSKSTNQAFLNYVVERIEYPSRQCFGKMVFQFIVSPDGNLENVQLVKGLGGCPEYESEAIAIVSSMPKWTPGRMGSLPVRVLITMPINVDPSEKL